MVVPHGCGESTLGTMILSAPPPLFPFLHEPLLASACLLAVLAYACAASLSKVWASPRPGQLILLAAWGLHGLAMVLLVGGPERMAPGLRLGFAPMLGMTAWLVCGIFLWENRQQPHITLLRPLALLGMLGLTLCWFFPGRFTLVPVHQPLLALHWFLGTAAYGLMGAAVVHALLMHRLEKQLRHKQASCAPQGLPLLTLERLTFVFVGAAFGVLSLALVLALFFSPAWQWNHKVVFTLLAWLVLAGLLLGRQRLGWRGRVARRGVYAAALFMLLGYVGSRFVLEVLLQRGAGG
jgi:ABC-type uncharacterized transport system permease subunit